MQSHDDLPALGIFRESVGLSRKRALVKHSKDYAKVGLLCEV